jgi:hypothetical protein
MRKRERRERTQEQKRDFRQTISLSSKKLPSSPPMIEGETQTILTERHHTFTLNRVHVCICTLAIRLLMS